MTHFPSWMAETPLAMKLFIFFAVLVIIPHMFVGAVVHHYTAVELEEEARNFSWEVIKQAETHVEYYIGDLEVTSLKILNHPDLVDFSLRQSDREKKEDQLPQAVVGLLKSAIYSRADISGITVIMDQAIAIDSNYKVKIETAGDFQGEWWYHAVPYDSSPLVFRRMLRTSVRQEPVITMARRIYNIRTLEPIGILLIDINYRRIQDISEQVTVAKKGHFFILDKQGHYVYHPDESKLGQSLDTISFRIFGETSPGTAVRINKGQDFLTFSSSTYLGWHFVTSIPYTELSRPTDRIGQTVLIAVVLTLVAAYLLGLFFASSILRPIRRLQFFMKGVETGDFTSQVVVETSDEIGQLSRGFNSMVERLNDMVKEISSSRLRETEGILRQKDMELKVLQSQLNPHFLYNSLETIRGMALERNADDIATMSASLGQLLRYNLRHQLPVVLLREEIRFSQLYLQIQEYRFEGQFSYQFSIPDWAWELPVLKFSLQPILENCFIHSVGFAKHPIVITISVRKINDESFSITIHDNGAGIQPNKLKKIRLDLERRNVMTGGSSIGLLNVQRRITRMYDGEYGLKLESSPGKGTTVTLQLPTKQVYKEGKGV